ncbi:unnamed protein product, partial [Polarella glacialis]
MKARVARAPVLAPPVTQRPNESRFKSVCQTSPSRAKLPFSPPETPSTAAPSTLSTPLASPSRKVPGLGRAWDSALEEASTLGWPPTGFLAGLELPFPTLALDDDFLGLQGAASTLLLERTALLL